MDRARWRQTTRWEDSVLFYIRDISKEKLLLHWKYIFVFPFYFFGTIFNQFLLFMLSNTSLFSFSFSHVLHPFRRQRIERMRVNREKDKLGICDETGKDIDRTIKMDRWGRGSKLGWDGGAAVCLVWVWSILVTHSSTQHEMNGGQGIEAGVGSHRERRRGRGQMREHWEMEECWFYGLSHH